MIIKFKILNKKCQKNLLTIVIMFRSPEAADLFQDQEAGCGYLPMHWLWTHQKQQWTDCPEEPCGVQAPGWYGGVSMC